MDQSELSRAAAVAEEACELARAEILPRFKKVAVEFKSDGSPVTEADRAAERVIRARLQDAYPSFGLLGEEYGEEQGGSADEPQWIVDPIDGTIAFCRGIPLFGTLIALMVGGEPVLGVIDLPALGERYVGWRGGGVRRNDVPVHASTQKELGHCLVSVGDPICFDWAGQRPVLDRLSHECPLLRGYTDAFGHSLVLAGGLDVMVDCYLNPWDAAATQVLAVEAGGACVSRVNEAGKIDLIFGSPPLVEQIEGYFQ